MSERKITGAIAIGGAVYRAGQEPEMEAAAEAAGLDLSDARFAGTLEGYDAPAPKAKSKAKK